MANRYLLMKYSNRKSLSNYFKCFLFILMIYFLLISSLFIWFEKSFEEEYYSQTVHLDPLKLLFNADLFYGKEKIFFVKKYLIENRYFCLNRMKTNGISNQKLLILVQSFSSNKDQRQSIRLTWGNKRILEKFQIQLAFVLGKTQENISIEEESNLFQDIIQIDLFDDHYSSSKRLILIFHWIYSYCRTSTNRDLENYFLLIDDNYYLNVNYLKSYLNQIDQNREMTVYERQTFVTGYRIDKSRPKRTSNDPESISFDDYPYHFYPSYLSTECLLMTKFSVQLFSLASNYISLFPFDSIYLGFLAHSMSIEFIKNNQLFLTSQSNSNYFQQISLSKFESMKYFNQSFICHYGFNHQQLIDYWNHFHQD